MTSPNKRFIVILLSAGFLLVIPLIAKAFTSEMKWDVFDFIVAGVLLFGTGIAIEIALRMITKFEYRVAACVAILVGLAVVWAELAVGIFGTPLAGS